MKLLILWVVCALTLIGVVIFNPANAEQVRFDLGKESTIYVKLPAQENLVVVSKSAGLTVRVSEGDCEIKIMNNYYTILTTRKDACSKGELEVKSTTPVKVLLEFISME
jgi:hypothetical protein